MCKVCIFLGALFNVSELDKFQCHNLSKFDFTIGINPSDIVDNRAKEYLKNTIKKFEEFGVDLVPVHVDSDGSCLPHSISRSLMGVEIYYDCLRASLRSELLEHKAWYHANVPAFQIVDNVEFEILFAQYVEAASPTRGQAVDREKYLEGVHILAFANLLMRPILLLDTPENMARVYGREINGCGLYLPLRHTRESIINTLGRIAPPIVIAWTSQAKDHYCAMAFHRPMDYMNTIIRSIIGRVSADSQHTLFNQEEVARAHFFLTIIEGLKFPGVEDFCFLAPVIRNKCASILITMLENLNKHLRNPTEDTCKYCKFSEKNLSIRYYVLRVKPALDILQYAGFRSEIVTNGTREYICTAALHPNRIVADDIIARNSELLNYLRACSAHGVLGDCTFPRTPVLPADTEQQLFGALPFLSHLLVDADVDVAQVDPAIVWRTARERFAEGEEVKGPGIAWIFSTGEDGSDFMKEMNNRALASLKSLSQNSLWAKDLFDFGIRTEDGITNILRRGGYGIAAQVKCPVCETFSQFQFPQNLADPYFYLDNLTNPIFGYQDFTISCPTCLMYGRNTVLSVTDCLYVKIFQWIKDLFSSRTDTCSLGTEQDTNVSYGAGAASAQISNGTHSSITQYVNGNIFTNESIPRLWSCPHIFPEGRCCRVGNDINSIVCYACCAERPGVTLAMRAAYDTQIAQQPTVSTAEEDYLRQCDKIIQEARKIDVSISPTILIFVERFQQLVDSARKEGIAKYQSSLESFLALITRDLMAAATMELRRNLNQQSKYPRLSPSVDTDRSPWSCKHCTFENTIHRNVCEVCQSSRHVEPSWSGVSDSESTSAVGYDSQSQFSEDDASTARKEAIAPSILKSTLSALSGSQVTSDAETLSFPSKPAKLYKSNSDPASTRIYAVVKESTLIANNNNNNNSSSFGFAHSPLFPSRSNMFTENISVDDSEMKDDIGLLSPSPATPMHRQYSAPVTIVENQKAKACLSSEVQSERIMWDECWSATREDA